MDRVVVLAIIAGLLVSVSYTTVKSFDLLTLAPIVSLWLPRS